MSEYECKKCGLCCMGHLILEASVLDVLREPQISQLGQELDTDSESDLGEPCWSLNTGIKITGLPACPFAVFNTLTGNCTCMIYKARPSMCVAFEPGGGQCLGLRQEVGLVEKKVLEGAMA